ncbi:HAD family hydrolase [Paenibacillus apiarius]|uniref:HAD-IB family hydrolase n=1 Tax=Paenibacillus apiarius TaxID=46240 RepID=A0ABT4DNU2_9BACL|nr:HAD family hydrolase [Paenibacillus apiarius]MBN3525296.1 HAD-IB family hydrolase [Paenibacillus apiarius]MCY9513015.1 HAD-IB family hydrolase [Paenibacillus apiarius]MCY9518999.1 HAD-IB family hydrolase [Paenibacillus apiarius]MCY9550808.1 HAD-IB family hydrolase [Paenibacillus apiarius]MCY9559758.1 HAD-IB family hydrolase [Paenibacillus apiarius]
MPTKIAFFDIDKTITRHDSMLLFVKYGIAKKPRAAIHLFSIAWNLLLYKLRRIPADKAKQAFFHAIAYMDEADLEAFYDDVLVKDMYQDAVAELKSKKAQGFRVLLVTASPHAYMKYFTKLGCVDEVIATRLEMRGGRYTRNIQGVNCKGEEKAVRIQEYLNLHQLAIDYEASCAYSDCMSDLPMFKLVKNGYLIHSNQGQSEGLEEIRWNS